MDEYLITELDLAGDAGEKMETSPEWEVYKEIRSGGDPRELCFDD